MAFPARSNGANNQSHETRAYRSTSSNAVQKIARLFPRHVHFGRESPSRRLINADFSHASSDAPSIPALGCRAGLVVAVMGGANMNSAVDPCYSIGFTTGCDYEITFSTASFWLPHYWMAFYIAKF